MYIRIFITSTFFATSHSEENTNLLGNSRSGIETKKYFDQN